MTDGKNESGGLVPEPLDDSGRMAELELRMSETTEDDDWCDEASHGSCFGRSEGLQEPEPGCCDMPIDEYDPGSMEIMEEDAGDAMARETEELALAEPEPPEGM